MYLLDFSSDSPIFNRAETIAITWEMVYQRKETLRAIKKQKLT
jgi:hypothetical protein